MGIGAPSADEVDVAHTTDWAELLFEKSADFILFWLSTEDVALAICSAFLLYLLCLLILGRPRTCVGFLSAWCSWVVLDVLVGRGWEQSISGIMQRGAHCYRASRTFAAGLVDLVVALLDVLAPFLSDAVHLLQRVWHRLGRRQRLWCFGVGLLAYSAIEAARAFSRNTGTLKRAAFEVSFLAVAPLLWFGSGLLSAGVLQQVLACMISVVPVALSFAHVWLTVPKEVQPGHSDASEKDVRRQAHETRKMWLSYWVCWPMLQLLYLAVQWLPQREQVTVSVTEMQQVLLVIVVWLQFWQAERLLSFLRVVGVANCTKLPTELINQLRKRLSFLFGGFFSFGRSSDPKASPGVSVALERQLEMASRAGKWQRFLEVFLQGSSVSVLACLLGLAILALLFEKAVRLLTDLMNIAIFFFAATDSADVVFGSSEDFYLKRLCFWVLAISWNILLGVPMLRDALHLISPLALGLFFLAGESILRFLLIPPVETISSSLVSAVQSQMPVAAVGEASSQGCERRSVSKGSNHPRSPSNAV
mmetsp:Transcript_29171/g.67843  ORF Transcript_29171/g.67843 Transcript_29171/m.67843 type:complete len:533 (+) Transcript_29171:102-1700(+)